MKESQKTKVPGRRRASGWRAVALRLETLAPERWGEHVLSLSNDESPALSKAFEEKIRVVQQKTSETPSPGVAEFSVTGFLSDQVAKTDDAATQQRL